MGKKKTVTIYIKNSQIVEIKNAPDDDYTIIDLDEDEEDEEDIFEEIFTIVIRKGKIINIYNMPDNYEYRVLRILS